MKYPELTLEEEEALEELVAREWQAEIESPLLRESPECILYVPANSPLGLATLRVPAGRRIVQQQSFGGAVGWDARAMEHWIKANLPRIEGAERARIAELCRYCPAEESNQ